MNSKVVETIMGALVLAVAVGFGLYLYAGTNDRAPSGYELRAIFLQTGGLQSGTDVRINGIDVGEVLGMDLDPKTFEAVVRMRVRRSIALPSDTQAAIGSAGVLGDKYIRLLPGTAQERIAMDGTGMITKTQNFKSLEDQVGEIIFLATGGDGEDGESSPKAPGSGGPGSQDLGDLPTLD